MANALHAKQQRCERLCFQRCERILGTGTGQHHLSDYTEAAKNLNGAWQDGAWQDLASMERLIFLMARPISRHSAQQSLNLPPGYERFIWVPLLDVMLPSLGLTTDALHLKTARRRFEDMFHNGF